MGKVNGSEYAHLYGCKYWAMWNDKVRPRYKVHAFIRKSNDLYWFETIPGKVIIGLTSIQFNFLTANGHFSPFLIECNRLNKPATPPPMPYF